MSTADTDILLAGSMRPAPTGTAVELGRVSLEIEDRGLRNFCIDGTEVINRVYVGVRDPIWDTLVGELVEQDLNRSGDYVTYTCISEHRGGDIDFSWRGRIRAGADGSLEFAMDGLAGSAFRYARIGINLLIPGELGGLPYRITAPGGLHGGVLPQAEIGAQAFMGGEFYALAPAFSELSVFLPWAEIRYTLEGDLFEIEDQRNWTDATFKVYSTPMSLGMRAVEAGEPISQRLVVTPPPPDPRPRRRASRQVSVLAPAFDAVVKAPAVGLCHTLTERSLSARERALLRALRPSHLRVEMAGIDRSSIAQTEAAVGAAQALETGIELALHLTGGLKEDEIHTLRGVLESMPVDRLLVFDTAEFVTPGALSERLRETLGQGLPVYGGTNLYFADVNRQRPDAGTCDGFAFSINPQVHAFDERSLVETLPVQADVVRSARYTFAGGVPLAVTPITLRPRFNPDAADGVSPDSALPYAVDARQPSLFCASWTVGSIKYLAEAGADSVTYFGTAGWEGVIERDEGPAAPELFHSSAGNVYPVYHVFRAVAEFPGDMIVPVRSTDPRTVLALGLRAADRVRLLVANVTPKTQRLRIDDEAAAGASLRTMDTTTVATATADPDGWISSSKPVDAAAGVDLLPYATAVVDYRTQSS